MPAFLVPFVFVLDPVGQGLLLMGSMSKLAQANWASIALVTAATAAGIVALAAGLQGWFVAKTHTLERWTLLAAGLLLVYPNRTGAIVGLLLVVAIIALQWRRPR